MKYIIEGKLTNNIVSIGEIFTPRDNIPKEVYSLGDYVLNTKVIPNEGTKVVMDGQLLDTLYGIFGFESKMISNKINNVEMELDKNIIHDLKVYRVKG